ncbi:hypothetical protein [Streptomyces sp. NPDC003077]|uniref:hypothetical protein n=1 Tax=Streptomyces sp. NPDC003077 TaxID=3154443 RepID=UPI0033A80FFF
MATDFRIDVERVTGMLGKLATCDERMRDASKRLQKVGPKALGTDGLDDACDEFQSQWGDGIKRIADAAKDIHERLQATLDAYKAGENENAKMLGKK